ncbi:hypothetical protein SAMN05428977_10458 [Nitrosomonas sp. Nm166]|nr:hypothetical protein SAMN05428977_10458 [Nitrosomonas sp. Nm166]
MMLQVLFDHLFCHLTYCRAKIPSCPKTPSPILLLQVWKFLKQIARCSSFYPSHDLTRSHLRRTTHQYMHMILTHYTLYNHPDFKCFARLTNQLSNAFCYLSFQNLIDTSLPIQNGIQFDKPYDFHIYNPCHTSCVAYSRS